MRQLIRGSRATAAGGWGSYQPAATFDTRIGLGVDANGLTTLTKDASARYVYVKNGGSDANSGLTDALAKATLNAGFNALRSGFGDWLLVDKNSSFADGFLVVNKRSGLSASYPTVVTTYDATDSANTAKFRLGTFTFATAPTGDILDMSSGGAGGVWETRFLYFENGRCAKPLGTVSTAALTYSANLLGASDGLSRLWMFCNWSWGPCHVGVQGDNTGDESPSCNCTGNTTSGSPNITGVSLTGGNTPVAGDHISSAGPNSGIPEDSTVVSWTPGTSTLVINVNATSTKTGAAMNFRVPRWFFDGVIFRRCVFHRSESAGLYLGPVTNATIEDCIGYHSGWIGTSRDAYPNLTMSANATASATIVATVSGASTGTFNVTTTNGSAVLTNVSGVNSSSYLDDSNGVVNIPITGAGIPGSTTIANWDKTYHANIYKHNFYFSTGTPNTIFRRNVSAAGSSHGLQARGGGQISDNIFAGNPLNLTLGAGDYYNYARPSGVTISGGHNIIVGTSPIDAASRRGIGIQMTNISSGSQTKNIITKYGGATAAGPYNNQPLSPTAQFAQPSLTNMSSSIVHDWLGEFTLAYVVSSATFPAQITGALTNNDVDADTSSWNGFSASSGNTTGTSYPDPERTIATYATANGYANEQALWDYVILHPEVNWALSMQAYFQAGFGH